MRVYERATPRATERRPTAALEHPTNTHATASLPGSVAYVRLCTRDVTFTAALHSLHRSHLHPHVHLAPPPLGVTVAPARPGAHSRRKEKPAWCCRSNVVACSALLSMGAAVPVGA